MKIFVFEPHAQREGHFSMYAANVCREMGRAGTEVVLFTTRLSWGEFVPSPPRFETVEAGPGFLLGFQKRADLAGGLVRGISLIWDNVRCLAGLLRRVRTEAPEAVHLFDYEPVGTLILMGLFRMTARFRRSAFYFVLHAPDTSLHGHSNPLYRFYSRLARPALRLLLSRFAAGVTVHGTWEKGELERILGLKAGRPPIYPVPHGAILCETRVDREEARRKIGLDYSGTLFLFFGMLRRDKGIEVLIEAMGRMNGEARLLMAGLPFDWGEEEVRAMIRRHRADARIEARLRYIPQNEVVYYFSAADAVVYPYRPNHMGAVGSLNTVLSMGLPVVASEVRELADYLRIHRIGIPVLPGDPLSLAKGLETFLGMTSAERRAMGEHNRQVAGEASWEAVARRFIEIYGEGQKRGEVPA